MVIFPVISVRVSGFPPTPTSPHLTNSISLSLADEGGVSGEPKPSRRMRKKLRETQDYERRRALWLERYGSFQALQSTFGIGPILGDLNPEQTRRLYHTLLPRSLLGLYEMEVMKPEELAPLAYEARIAAKEYARSRCMWTGRILTSAFDQYRNLRDKGQFVFGSSSMTWEEIWDKYEAQIRKEEESSITDGSSLKEKKRRPWRIKKDEESDSLTMRIYLRILERSCETNQVFDSLFLKDETDDEDSSNQLAAISAKLEEDVRMVLLRPKESDSMIRKQKKAVKKQQKDREKKERTQQKDRKKEEKRQRKDRIKEEKKQRNNSNKQESTEDKL